MKSVEEIKEIKNDVKAELFKIPGVNAVAIGPKVVAGKKKDELAIIVFVDKKRDNVPPNEKIPGIISGVITDVVQRNPEIKLHSGKLDYEVTGGLNVGANAPDGRYSTGTLGAIVYDQADWLMLSCNHVFNAFSILGIPIHSPSGQGQIVGHLRTPVLTSDVDAAVAKIDQSLVRIKCGLDGHGGQSIGPLSSEPFDDNQIAGRTVKKKGIITGVTYGTAYPFADAKQAGEDGPVPLGFQNNQIYIEPLGGIFSQEGDSGSLVVDNETGRPIGLLGAGETAPRPDGKWWSVANHIQIVLDSLKVKICGG